MWLCVRMLCTGWDGTETRFDTSLSKDRGVRALKLQTIRGWSFVDEGTNKMATLGPSTSAASWVITFHSESKTQGIWRNKKYHTLLRVHNAKLYRLTCFTRVHWSNRWHYKQLTSVRSAPVVGSMSGVCSTEVINYPSRSISKGANKSRDQFFTL